MKMFLLKTARMYLYNSPLRLGKIPMMKLASALGLTKGVETVSVFDGDLRIKLRLDEWIQKQIYFFGEYILEDTYVKFWNSLLRKGDIVFDIGANIGYYSMLAAKRISPEGRVYSFEPVSSTFACLKENAGMNNFENIILTNAGVSDTKGTTKIYVADITNTGTSSLAMQGNFSGVTEEVFIITIDEFAEENRTSRADIIKIDVEGCEYNALKGMKKLLESYKPLVLIEIVDERLKLFDSSKENIFDFFESIGFFGFEITGEKTIRKYQRPSEGGLILFMHKDYVYSSRGLVKS